MSIPVENLTFLWDQVINPRLGHDYVWGGSFSEDPSDGTDCSGAVSAELCALVYGPSGMIWDRQFYTGTFAGAQPGDYGPFGGAECTRDLICIASPGDAPFGTAMIIAIRQEPDPTDAHMICSVPSRVGGPWTTIEMGGNANNYHLGEVAIDDSEFDQWLYLPGPIIGSEVVAPMPPQGLDYAGAKISGASIASAGYKFVCRYLSDGGNDMPNKLLQPDEAADLRANGVDIVSNWETIATMMLGGRDQGVFDARNALAWHFACGGPGWRPIYFSADFDATPEQQMAIDEYLRGVASVIGLEWTGIYGGYWPVKRALDNGTATWGWQTQAWSGDNQDPRIKILQNNDAGYIYIDGTQCDRDEARAADYGQWSAAVAPAPPPPPPPAPPPPPPPPAPVPPPPPPPCVVVPSAPEKVGFWRRHFPNLYRGKG